MLDQRKRANAQRPSSIALSLEAVIVAVTDNKPRLLAVSTSPDRLEIPSGPLDPEGDATLEHALRGLIRQQTGLEVGYAEQLYTFGDRDRRRDRTAPRLLSVAYLALVREEQPSNGAAWIDYYMLFPWEDHRDRSPAILDERILPHLKRWAAGDDARQARMRVTFGVDSAPWDPIRVLERYELLYEAALIEERFLDRNEAPPADLQTGMTLSYDHRRIAASALGRLRGKLTYRPVVFELLGETFTLTELQHTVEALFGMRIHKQNFRRQVEQGRLVEGTGQHRISTGGRPAELFRFREEVLGERPRPGLLRPRP
jgi:hypothetical protein